MKRPKMTVPFLHVDGKTKVMAKVLIQTDEEKKYGEITIQYKVDGMTFDVIIDEKELNELRK